MHDGRQVPPSLCGNACQGEQSLWVTAPGCDEQLPYLLLSSCALYAQVVVQQCLGGCLHQEAMLVFALGVCCCGHTLRVLQVATAIVMPRGAAGVHWQADLCLQQ